VNSLVIHIILDMILYLLTAIRLITSVGLYHLSTAWNLGESWLDFRLVQKFLPSQMLQARRWGPSTVSERRPSWMKWLVR